MLVCQYLVHFMGDLRIVLCYIKKIFFFMEQLESASKKLFPFITIMTDNYYWVRLKKIDRYSDVILLQQLPGLPNKLGDQIFNQ